MGRHRAGKRRYRRYCRRKKGHESNPELPSPRRPGRETRDTSPAWNSLDEESLVDYALNAAESPGEMEVTKRLSCLNFSAVPCAMDPANFDRPNIAGGALQLAGEQESDTELVSELTSATHVEALLPGEGREGEEEELSSRRPNRKRTSRRRPNKKAKKMKGAFFPGAWSGGPQPQLQPPHHHHHPGHAREVAAARACEQQRAREDKKRMPERRSTLSRARYNPVARAPSDREEGSLVLDVSIPCLYPHVLIRRMEVEDGSDTSAMCDMEATGHLGDEMITASPDGTGDARAAVNGGACCLSCSCDDSGGGGGGGECVCDNESELSSDSTTDR